jgi:hypothetical protein
MKIIAFAWTTPALLAGRKSCTRRDWSPDYAGGFRKGDLVAAYNRNPRHGGRQVATLRLTDDPGLSRTCDAPDSDYEAEGFAYLQEQGKKVDGVSPLALWRHWKRQRDILKWVIRFDVIEIMEVPHARNRIADRRRQGAMLLWPDGPSER